MACMAPSSAVSPVSHGPSTFTSPVKADEAWPVTSAAATHLYRDPAANAESLCSSAKSSAAATPVAGSANAFPRSSPVAETSALRRLVCRSSIMAPFMVERAAKGVVELPPPIHRLYDQADKVTARVGRQRSDSVVCSGSESDATVESGSASTDAARCVQTEGGAALPRGDLFDFSWTTKQMAAMRVQQREYLRLQRRGPHAPILVQMEDLASHLVEDEEACDTVADETATSAAKDKCIPPGEVARTLAGFCTRAIPQSQYVDGVFRYRLNVLQRRIDPVPTGVVVPSVVAPTMTLDEVDAARRGEGKGKGKGKGEPAVKTSEPTVTYPHPGTPFTYHDLVQSPLLLSADQRADRRAAVLHQRTLSEDVYGAPVPYT